MRKRPGWQRRGGLAPRGLVETATIERKPSPAAPDPLDFKLGRFFMTTSTSSLDLHVDAAAWFGSGSTASLCLLSAAGPSTSVKAIAAALTIARSPGNFYLECDQARPYGSIMRWNNDWRIFRHKLGYNTWHLLALTEDAHFIPVVSDEAIWRQLRSEQLTTPVLRSWVPWLRKQMKELNYLRSLSCFRCDAALLFMTVERLDELVTKGIQSGQLKIA